MILALKPCIGKWYTQMESMRYASPVNLTRADLPP